MTRSRKNVSPDRAQPGVTGGSTVAVIVAAAALATYLRTLDFDFTYDDHHHFLKNAFVQELGNLRDLLPWRYFGREFPDQARPVMVLSHFVDRAVGGSASACHMQSALWHALTAVLVFVLAQTLKFNLRTAGFAGVLFALHPALVEAVAGISNREDVLATCFGILCLLAARRALGGSARSLALVGLTYALSLLAKESALSVPLLLVVLAVASPSFRASEHARRRWLNVALVFGAVTLAWAGFQLRLGYPSLLPAAGGTGLERASIGTPMLGARSLVAWQLAGGPRAEPSTPGEPSVPPLAAERRRPQGAVSLADAPALEAFRAWQLVVPWPTAPEYDLAPFRTPWARVFGASALALLAWVLYRDLRGRRRLSLGIGWFFAASVPISIPTLLLNPLADRYLYLPAVGVALMLAWAVAERLPEALKRPDLSAPAMLGCSVLFFGLTSANVLRFRNDVTLFTAATESAPHSARAAQNLGSALLGEQRLDEARVALDRAIFLDPNLLAARVNRGLLEEVRGRPDLAATEYRAALEIPRVVAEQKLAARACGRLAAIWLAQGQRTDTELLLARERARAADAPCTVAVERALGAR